jgi:hypothetical protein
MTSRTIVCSECGEDVPYGRLSCPSCGALLASVAGGSRSPGATADQAPPSEPEIIPLLGDDAPLSMAPSSVSQSGPREAPDAPPPPASAASAIGGYMPPGSSVPPPTPRVAPPPPPVLTAVAQAPPTVSPVAAPIASAVAADEDAAAKTPWWEVDGLDVGIDRAVAIGAGMVAIGLLLPWSSRVVIGSTDISSYFGRWGLTGPGHILVLIAAVVIAVLAVVPNRIPAWLRSGVGGLLLGMFVIGLVWPYIVGPLGASIGSLMDLVGSIVLIVAGVLAVWRSRHVTDGPGV